MELTPEQKDRALATAQTAILADNEINRKAQAHLRIALETRSWKAVEAALLTLRGLMDEDSDPEA
jgi:hypothetical protein